MAKIQKKMPRRQKAKNANTFKNFKVTSKISH